MGGDHWIDGLGIVFRYQFFLLKNLFRTHKVLIWDQNENLFISSNKNLNCSLDLFLVQNYFLEPISLNTKQIDPTRKEPPPLDQFFVNSQFVWKEITV